MDCWASSSTGSSTPSTITAMPRGWSRPHLHERDVDVGIAQARAHRADAAGLVIVLQDEQVRDVLNFNI